MQNLTTSVMIEKADATRLIPNRKRQPSDLGVKRKLMNIK